MQGLFPLPVSLHTVRPNSATLQILVVGVGIEPVRLAFGRLAAEVHRAQVLCRVIDGATQQDELSVEGEQRRIAPVGVDTAVLKHGADAAVRLDERIFFVAVEVTMGEMRGLATLQGHDAVSAIADLGTVKGEILRTAELQAVGTAAVEITVDDYVVASPRNTDDPARAATSHRMSDGEVAHRTLLAVHEVETERVARLHNNAGIALALYDELLHVHHRQLAAVEHLFADHRGPVTANAARSIRHPHHETCAEQTLVVE